MCKLYLQFPACIATHSLFYILFFFLLSLPSFPFSAAKTAPKIARADAKLMACIYDPEKIVCIGYGTVSFTTNVDSSVLALII